MGFNAHCANKWVMTRKWDPNIEQYRDSGKFGGNDNAAAAGGMTALAATAPPPQSDEQRVETFLNAILDDDGVFEQTPESVESLRSALTDMVGDKHYQSFYADQNSRLQDQQVRDLMEGGYDIVLEDMESSWLDDYQEESHEDFVTEHLERYDLSADDFEYEEVFRDIAYDNDTSDPIADIARQTPPVLVRAGLLEDLESDISTHNLFSGHSDGVRERRTEYLSAQLSAQGIDMDEPDNLEAVEEMVDNGPWDWNDGLRLDVIDYADMDEILPMSLSDPSILMERETTYINPHVVLIDTGSGSGHNVQFTGKITHTSNLHNETTRLRLDEEERGYGWDQTAGVVKSYYQTDKTTKFTRVVPSHDDDM